MPEPTTPEGYAVPVFATALRGYARNQVDDYVATLLTYLHEAHERAVAAESQLLQRQAADRAPADASAVDVDVRSAPSVSLEAVG